MHSTVLFVWSLVGLFPPLYSIIDLVVLERSNCLIPAARKLIMLSKLLIMPSVEHTMQIIEVVFLRLLMLWLRDSMELQRSHIINAPGML